MSINSIKVSRPLQYMLMVLVYIREIMLAFNITSITTSIYYAFIGMCIIWCFVCIISYHPDRDFIMKLSCLCLIIILIYFIVFKIENNSSKTNEAIGRLALILVLLIITENSTSANKTLLKFNTTCNVLLSVTLFLMMFSPTSYIDGQLVYNYVNPNSTGLSAYICLISLFIGLHIEKNQLKKNMVIISIGMVAVVLLRSASRTSILSFAVFFVISYMMRNKQEIRLPWKIIISIVAFILIYPYLWVAVFNLFGARNIYILGKPVFSYRELIWNYMFMVLVDNPWVSHMGESVVYGSGPHNVCLGIWWEYGIVFMVLFLVMILRYYKIINDRCSCKVDYRIVAAVLSAMISMTFEVLLFSGGLNFSFRLFYLSSFIGLKYDESANRSIKFKFI